jgi:hypothetical protein
MSSEVSAGEEPDRCERLRAIFLDVTGTEELVETQTREPANREVRPEGSLSEYVAEMAEADGLADTFDDPDEGALFE